MQDELEDGRVEAAALHQGSRHRLEEVGGDEAQRGGQVRLLLLLVNHLGRGGGGAGSPAASAGQSPGGGMDGVGQMVTPQIMWYLPQDPTNQGQVGL